MTKPRAPITPIVPTVDNTYANADSVRANHPNFSTLFLNLQKRIASVGA